MAQVVGWARQQGIYVILDMHQDQYSSVHPARESRRRSPPVAPRRVEVTAPPAWAVFTDGKPACALFGESDLNPAEGAAFYNFWHNHPVPSPRELHPGPGLEDHYIGALGRPGRTFRARPDGSRLRGDERAAARIVGGIPRGEPLHRLSQDLFPFYQRVIEALTGVRDGLSTCPDFGAHVADNACAYPQLADVSHQQIFVEPMAYRNLVDFSPQVSKPFSRYKNLVWAPHIYTHAFTLDQFIGYPVSDQPVPAVLRPSATRRRSPRRRPCTPPCSQRSSVTRRVPITRAGRRDRRTGVHAHRGNRVGVERPGPDRRNCWCVRWQHSTYQTTANGPPGKGNPNSVPSPNDELIPSRVEYLSRVVPEDTAGALLAYREIPSNGTFALLATDSSAVPPGDASLDTVVSIPSTVHGGVDVSGQAKLQAVITEPDGDRLAYVDPTGSHGAATTPPLGDVGSAPPAAASPQTEGAIANAAPTSGTYGVTVGAASAALRTAVEDEALRPPQPINEVTARATFEKFLKTAEASPNAHIRANANLVAGLASLLLGSQDPNSA